MTRVVPAADYAIEVDELPNGEGRRVKAKGGDAAERVSAWNKRCRVRIFASSIVYMFSVGYYGRVNDLDDGCPRKRLWCWYRFEL